MRKLLRGLREGWRAIWGATKRTIRLPDNPDWQQNAGVLFTLRAPTVDLYIHIAVPRTFCEEYWGAYGKSPHSIRNLAEQYPDIAAWAINNFGHYRPDYRLNKGFESNSVMEYAAHGYRARGLSQRSIMDNRMSHLDLYLFDEQVERLRRSGTAVTPVIPTPQEEPENPPTVNVEGRSVRQILQGVMGAEPGGYVEPTSPYFLDGANITTAHISRASVSVTIARAIRGLPIFIPHRVVSRYAELWQPDMMQLVDESDRCPEVALWLLENFRVGPVDERAEAVLQSIAQVVWNNGYTGAVSGWLHSARIVSGSLYDEGLVCSAMVGIDSNCWDRFAQRFGRSREDGQLSYLRMFEWAVAHHRARLTNSADAQIDMAQIADGIIRPDMLKDYEVAQPVVETAKPPQHRIVRIRSRNKKGAS